MFRGMFASLLGLELGAQMIPSHDLVSQPITESCPKLSYGMEFFLQNNDGEPVAVLAGLAPKEHSQWLRDRHLRKIFSTLNSVELHDGSSPKSMIHKSPLVNSECLPRPNERHTHEASRYKQLDHSCKRHVSPEPTTFGTSRNIRSDAIQATPTPPMSDSMVFSVGDSSCLSVSTVKSALGNSIFSSTSDSAVSDGGTELHAEEEVLFMQVKRDIDYDLEDLRDDLSQASSSISSSNDGRTQPPDTDLHRGERQGKGQGCLPGCKRVFNCRDDEDWTEHIIRDHLRLGVPTAMVCPFCEKALSSGTHVANDRQGFKDMMVHIRSHQLDQLVKCEWMFLEYWMHNTPSTDLRTRDIDVAMRNQLCGADNDLGHFRETTESIHQANISNSCLDQSPLSHVDDSHETLMEACGLWLQKCSLEDQQVQERSASQIPTQTKRARSSTQPTQRKRQKGERKGRKLGDDGDDRSDDEGSTNEITTQDGDPRYLKPFACPFYKHNSADHAACAYCAYSDWPQVRTHLIRKHQREIPYAYCSRCKPACDSEQAYNNHINSEPQCSFIEAGALLPTIQDISEQIRGLPSKDKWIKAYGLLFGKEQEIPNPAPLVNDIAFETKSLATVVTNLTQTLSGKVLGILKRHSAMPSNPENLKPLLNDLETLWQRELVDPKTKHKSSPSRVGQLEPEVLAATSLRDEKEASKALRVTKHRYHQDLCLVDLPFENLSTALCIGRYENHLQATTDFISVPMGKSGFPDEHAYWGFGIYQPEESSGPIETGAVRFLGAQAPTKAPELLEDAVIPEPTDSGFDSQSGCTQCWDLAIRQVSDVSSTDYASEVSGDSLAMKGASETAIFPTQSAECVESMKAAIIQGN